MTTAHYRSNDVCARNYGALSSKRFSTRDYGVLSINGSSVHCLGKAVTDGMPALALMNMDNNIFAQYTRAARSDLRRRNCAIFRCYRTSHGRGPNIVDTSSKPL